ncbi:3D domain-containing protein [Prosthecobacter sp. SYSU 5D2]|uniref:3D domain-containing protein n=1 Tax=Prosthecobacter sp. SYSU 5D2 TaxID=3134134 RepID=UPI0031FED888
MTRSILLCLTVLCAQSLAGEVKIQATKPTGTPGQILHGIRTTAYTHSEADHIKYGSRTASGTSLKYGQVRSAAADWSVYPVGTVFQIEGDSALYIVDDYGSALVGTKTIDLYKPTSSSMNIWGVRKVNIRIVKWGCFVKSLAILKPRQSKASHVREMVSRLVSRPA